MAYITINYNIVVVVGFLRECPKSDIQFASKRNMAAICWLLLLLLGNKSGKGPLPTRNKKATREISNKNNNWEKVI